jgi:hypothetical protein
MRCGHAACERSRCRTGQYRLAGSQSRFKIRWCVFDWQAVFGWPWTLKTSLRAARRIAINAGLRYVYTGNIRDPAGQSTLLSLMWWCADWPRLV